MNYTHAHNCKHRCNQKRIKVYHNGKKLGSLSLNPHRIHTARILFIVLILTVILYPCFVLLNQALADMAYVPDPVVVKDTIVVRDDTLPPILQRIAHCESGNKQFDSKGRVVRGTITSADTGKFQINKVIWGTQAKKLGYDLEILEGNEAMAVWIFENRGSVPWRASSFCWNR